LPGACIIAITAFGGECQRVAIARALVNDPDIVLADEPTGNLDSATAHEIMALVKKLHGRGQTIVMVTHEADISAYAGRIITLKDGKIINDSRILRSCGQGAARPLWER